MEDNNKLNGIPTYGQKKKVHPSGSKNIAQPFEDLKKINGKPTVRTKEANQ